MMSKLMKYFARMVMCGLLIAACAMPAGAYDKSFYAENSKLASGKWVKVVTDDGRYTGWMLLDRICSNSLTTCP